MKSVASFWASRETTFSQRSYDGGDEGVVVVDRSSRILVSAPHGVNHHRGDEPKVADMFTGSLAVTLALLGDYSVVAASRRVSPWQSWIERQDEFGEALSLACEPGAFVLDLHGMSNEHGVDLCVGLGPSPGALELNFAARLELVFSRYRVRRNEPFPGRAPHTVTAHLQGMGVACVQLEIARSLRDPTGNPEVGDELVWGLLACLRE